MALATIDDDIYKEIQRYVEEHSVEYPTIKFFLDKVTRKELDRLKKKEVGKDE